MGEVDNVSKGLAIVMLFCIALLFGLIPVWLHWYRSSSLRNSPRLQTVLEYLNCFSGGVSMAACLLQLLPGGRKDFEEYKKLSGKDSDFPVCEFVAGVGTLLVALVEQTSFAMLFSSRSNQTEDICLAVDDQVFEVPYASNFEGNVSPLGPHSLADRKDDVSNAEWKETSQWPDSDWKDGVSNVDTKEIFQGPHSLADRKDNVSNADTIETSQRLHPLVDEKDDGSNVDRKETSQRLHPLVDLKDDGSNADRKEISQRLHPLVDLKDDGSNVDRKETSQRLHPLVDLKDDASSTSRADGVKSPRALRLEREAEHRAQHQLDHAAAMSHTAEFDSSFLLPYRSATFQSSSAHTYVGSRRDFVLRSRMSSQISWEFHRMSKMSVLRILPMMVALSFYTVFDGLAVGLQASPYHVWELVSAVAIHKALVTFCMGLELAELSSGNFKRPLIYVIFFSLISPVGIAIGMGITSDCSRGEEHLLATSILQGLATGTFMHVTFFEILAKPFARRHDQEVSTSNELAKVGFTSVGYSCMACVLLVTAYQSDINI